MSFVSDLSPVVKAVAIFGLLGLGYLGVAFVAKFPPFTEIEAVQERGLGTPQ